MSTCDIENKEVTTAANLEEARNQVEIGPYAVDVINCDGPFTLDLILLGSGESKAK